MFEADAIGRGTMPRPMRMHRRPANLGRIRAIATRPIRSTAGRHPAGRHSTGGRNIRPRMRRSSRHPARAVRGHRAVRRTRASVALVGMAPADLAPADLAPVGMAPADPDRARTVGPTRPAACGPLMAPNCNRSIWT